MSVETRPAKSDDAPFLAWVMQEAARSHLEKGIWDFVFPGDESKRLDLLAEICSSDIEHFAHYSRFRVLEVDGEPASALSAYENARFGAKHLDAPMAQILVSRGWTAEDLGVMAKRAASFEVLGYPNPDGLWIVEWVATKPEFRGRSLVRQLLREILEEGRAQGFERAQIGYLLGNVRAKSAYEGVGFEVVEEYRHADFEKDYGSPGLARMQMQL